MARYTGPVCKLSRREGMDLLLKSRVRSLEEKCRHDRVPGARSAQRPGRTSDYGLQLREKQKLRRMYGVLERQFRNYYKRAARQKGSTGDNLLRLLEGRLDNIVYRLGFAATRPEARQLVSHRGIQVNGRPVNIPVVPGQGRRHRGRASARQGTVAHSECPGDCPPARFPRVAGCGRQGPVRRRQESSPNAKKSFPISTKAWLSSCIRNKPECKRMEPSVHTFLKPRIVKVGGARRAESRAHHHRAAGARASATRWVTPCAACCFPACRAPPSPKPRSRMRCCTSTAPSKASRRTWWRFCLTSRMWRCACMRAPAPS